MLMTPVGPLSWLEPSIFPWNRCSDPLRVLLWPSRSRVPQLSIVSEEV